jgi:hypothetical protein
MLNAIAATPLQEHGFWDYTAPGTGGMEGYTRDEYAQLLDDVQASGGGGMNSVLVIPKWITTGYRSRLPFLDQHPTNPVTRSDNRLLRDFFDDAKRRGIKTWVGCVATMLPTRHVKTPSLMVHDGVAWGCPPPGGGGYGTYDLDVPEVVDRAPLICAELVEQFPMVDGFMLEMEWAAQVTPHREGPYNAWAKANGKPAFAELFTRFDGRSLEIGPWREYATHRRAELVKVIERELRAANFRGELSMLCETGRSYGSVSQEVRLDQFHAACPEWAAVSYEYSYDKNTPTRLGMMEMAIGLPKRAGMKTYYLPRGVMTWGGRWPMSISLEESWRRDIEDILRFGPDGVWWFGSGAGAIDGWHVNRERLKQSGFADGRDARKKLMETTRGRLTV